MGDSDSDTQEVHYYSYTLYTRYIPAIAVNADKRSEIKTQAQSLRCLDLTLFISALLEKYMQNEEVWLGAELLKKGKSVRNPSV